MAGGRGARLLWQAALALALRAAQVGTLGDTARDAVLVQLAGAAADRRDPQAAVARWFETALLPAIARRTGPIPAGDDARWHRAVAGVADARAPRLTWEGLAYVIDPAEAELARVAAVHAALDAPRPSGELRSESAARTIAA